MLHALTYGFAYPRELPSLTGMMPATIAALRGRAIRQFPDPFRKRSEEEWRLDCLAAFNRRRLTRSYAAHSLTAVLSLLRLDAQVDDLEELCEGFRIVPLARGYVSNILGLSIAELEAISGLRRCALMSDDFLSRGRNTWTGGDVTELLMRSLITPEVVSEIEYLLSARATQEADEVGRGRPTAMP